MKKGIFIIIFFTLSFSFISTTKSAPGDTISEALIATLGDNNSTMTAYNDYNYFNFTGSPYVSYNFTTWYDMSVTNYLPMYIYDENGTLIDSDVTGFGPWSLVLSGYDKYIIGHYAGEFTVTPMDFTLTITEVTAESGAGLNAAIKVNLGDTDGNFENYNDMHWYNFTGSTSETYEFELLHKNNSYAAISIYDGGMNILDSNWTISDTNFVSANGYDNYVIVVSASEFTELPMSYTLRISKEANNIESTTSTPNSNNSSTPKEDESKSEDNFPLPFMSGLSLIISIAVVSMIYIKLKTRITN